MNRTLKIIYFDFVGTFGGAQQSTSTLLNYLKKKYDINLKFYYIEGTNKQFLDSLDIDKEKVNFIFFKNFNIFKIGNKYIQAIIFYFILFIFLVFKNNNNSIFLCNSPKALILLSLLKIFKNIEVHYYCRGWGDPTTFHPFIRYILNKSVDKVYAVSESTSTNLKKFINPKKVFVTYTSVDLENIDLKKKDNLDISFPNNKIKIVFAGAIIKTKGLHTLLKSIGFIDSEIQRKYIIYIAGKFDKGDAYYKYCKEIEKNLNCKVLWLGWINNVPSLLYNVDIVCLPSYTEGLPRIIQEGMYLEKLCISTPVGGVPDLIKNGVTGFLFDIEDTKQLSKLLLEFSKGNFDIKNISHNAKKLLVSKYDLKIQAELFFQAISSDLQDGN